MPDDTRISDAAEDQSLIRRPLTRRQVLRGGLLAGGAAFLAACGTAATPAPTSAPSAAATAAATAAPTAAPSSAAPSVAASSAAPSVAASSAAPSVAASSAAPSVAASSAAPSSAAPSSAAAENFSGVTLHNFTGGYMIPWLDEGTKAWKAATGGDPISDNVDFASKQIKQAGIIATQDSSYDMMYTTAAYGYIQKFAERLLLPITADQFPDLPGFFPNSVKQLSIGDALRAYPLYDFPTLWGWNN